MNSIHAERKALDPGIIYVIKGIVCRADNTPVSSLTVKAFDRNVGEQDTLLGQTNTDATGKYSISYTLDQIGGKPSADLVICVYQENQLLQTSDVIFNAQPMEIKDFTLPMPAAPEFQRMSETIQPLLRGKIGLGELVKKETEFLSKKTGIEPRRIDWLAQSYRMAEGNETLANFYYGLLSQNFPTEPAALLKRDRDSVRRALLRAHDLNLVKGLAAEEIDNILDNILP